MAVPNILIYIGDAWVDPKAVIGVDEPDAEDTPSWANCRVLLRTGQVLHGRRLPARVVEAVRHPELENLADEGTELYPDPQTVAIERARRRHGRGGTPPPPQPMR